MSMKIRFGIIGCGRIGSRHAERISDNPLAELIAVSDINPTKLNESKNNYKIDSYLNYQDLLKREDIDVVSICTPNGLHAEMAIDTAKAGKHILCEKPMTIRVDNGEKMINAAEKNNVNLFVVKQNRYNPPVAKLKEIIDKGILGKIYMLVVNVFWNRDSEYYSESDWKGRLALDGGTLYTQVSHFIDLMLWYGGDFKNVEIIGKRNKHRIDFEDNGVVLTEFENGCIGSVNYTVCAEGENMEGSITVIAENGTVKIGGQYLNTLEYEKNDYGKYKGSMSNHAQVIQNVIDVLQNKGKQHVTATEALKTVEFIEQCYNKMKV
ncbi:MAG: Gfo/Idh/MocA family oxidoreductase [Ignavibacteriae bacterium]|nr:Gfo/Idh/MocA family oxidoreductase [Ignavibacteriota bacterium]